MSIKSLAHVCIKTTDLEMTTAFYSDALGMEKLFTFTRGGEVIGFYLKAANDTFIEVFLANELEKAGKPALDHFCLETDDIHALREALLQRGYAPGEIKLGVDHSWQFWIEDPGRLNLEFHQYGGESSQFTGADVEVDW